MRAEAFGCDGVIAEGAHPFHKGSGARRRKRPPAAFCKVRKGGCEQRKFRPPAVRANHKEAAAMVHIVHAFRGAPGNGKRRFKGAGGMQKKSLFGVRRKAYDADILARCRRRQIAAELLIGFGVEGFVCPRRIPKCAQADSGWPLVDRIERRINNRIPVALPGEKAVGVADDVRQIAFRVEVAHTDLVTPVSGRVHRIGKEAFVGRKSEEGHGEESAVSGEGVDVEDGFNAGWRLGGPAKQNGIIAIAGMHEMIDMPAEAERRAAFQGRGEGVKFGFDFEHQAVERPQALSRVPVGGAQKFPQFRVAGIGRPGVGV